MRTTEISAAGQTTREPYWAWSETPQHETRPTGRLACSQEVAAVGSRDANGRSCYARLLQSASLYVKGSAHESESCPGQACSRQYQGRAKNPAQSFDHLLAESDTSSAPVGQVLAVIP